MATQLASERASMTADDARIALIEVIPSLSAFLAMRFSADLALE